MAIGTGHGATATFNSSSISNVIEITMPEETLPAVDKTHLGTSNARAYTAGDLKDVGAGSLTLYEDGASEPNDLDGTEATMLITYKQQTGESTAANVSGTGFFVRRKLRDHQTNEMGIAELSWRWIGKPTYTAAT